jgi:hypothetical protein
MSTARPSGLTAISARGYHPTPPLWWAPSSRRCSLLFSSMAGTSTRTFVKSQRSMCTARDFLSGCTRDDDDTGMASVPHQATCPPSPSFVDPVFGRHGRISDLCSPLTGAGCPLKIHDATRSPAVSGQARPASCCHAGMSTCSFPCSIVALLGAPSRPARPRAPVACCFRRHTAL